eukprot:2087814-Alexandrium_andersonii.AAC.1
MFFTYEPDAPKRIRRIGFGTLGPCFVWTGTATGQPPQIGGDRWSSLALPREGTSGPDWPHHPRAEEPGPP